jgi:hypothetical protein
MKITLNQVEIEEALKQYVSGQGISVTGKSIEVNITAGRGPNGVTAELDIVSEAEIPSTAPAAKAAPTVELSLAPKADPAPAAEPETDSLQEDDSVEEATGTTDAAPFSGGKSLFGSD